MAEVISAQSALNMPPAPMAEPQGEFLSESDVWAAHAYEHLQAAFRLLTVASPQDERMRSLRGVMEEMVEYWENGTPVHPGCHLAERAQRLLMTFRSDEEAR